MIRGLPDIYGQRDFTQLLGFSPNVTIASAGCYLTSMAMIARYYGKFTDPVDLNRAFKAQNIYIGTDELPDSALTRIYPDVIFQEAFLYPNDPPTPADLEKLKELMADPTLSVILEIDIGGGNTHFVVCMGVNGTVTIANPWDKSQEDFSMLYGDPVKNILKYVVYKGTPASIDQQLIDQLRQQRDNNWNLYQAQIASTQAMQAQLNDNIKKLSDANETITNLKTEISQAHQSSSNLATELANKNKEDSTAIDQGITAQKQEGDLRDYLYAIASQFGVDGAKKKDKDLVDIIMTNIGVLETEVKTRDAELKKLNQNPVSHMVDNFVHVGWWEKIRDFIFE